jgi:hypothetical protein
LALGVIHADVLKKIGLGVFNAEVIVWKLMAGMILPPSFAQAVTIEVTQVGQESSDGGVVLLPSLLQECVQREHKVVAGLRDGKALGECRPKLGGSNNPSGMALSPKGEAMRGERDKQRASQTNECDGYCGFYAWPPLIL